MASSLDLGTIAQALDPPIGSRLGGERPPEWVSIVSELPVNRLGGLLMALLLPGPRCELQPSVTPG